MFDLVFSGEDQKAVEEAVIFGRQIASVDFPPIMRSSGVRDPSELSDLIEYLKEATGAE